MFRNLFTILLCSLSMLAASAQTATGWYKYPTFTETIDNLIATPDQVYYRTGTSLFSYRESDGENFVYSTDNHLSDVNIVEIYYNAEKKYLVVTYDNGNIDLIFDSGKTINLPDIKDANVYAGRNINGVSFHGDLLYVATDFGFVVFDTKRFEVKESAIFNEKVNWVGATDDYIMIYHDGAYLSAPLSSHHNRLDAFTKIFTDSNYAIQGFTTSDGKLCVQAKNNTVYVIDPAVANSASKLDLNCATVLRPAAEGRYYSSDGNYLIIISGEGKADKLVPLNGDLKGKKVSYFNTPDELWAATNDGIAKYSVGGELLIGGILPMDCITVNKVNLMKWSPDYERLYISQASPDKGRPGSFAEADWHYQTTNIIDNRTPRDVSLKECSLINYYNGIAYQDRNGNKRLYGGFYWMCENPFDKDMYFISSDWNGVLAAKDNKMVTSFTSDNAKYNPGGYANRAQGVFIDPQNNLWVNMLSVPCLQVLPAQKLKPENITSVTSADWRTTAIEGRYGEKNFTMLFSTKSNLAYIYNGNYGFGLVAYDTKGTYVDPSDDEARQWYSLTDQDGKGFTPIRIHALTEDKNGNIWVGTTSGVCVITDPSKGLSDSFTVRRPKVPRSDGTNFADYLLESDAVLWIGVDPANNKWLATENSGLYLVNPDGTQILAQFNTGNSPLASNTIYSVEQDPYSNIVYVGTDAGLYRFNCATSPAAEDYSNIYAYPNPVRPEYTGPITITGLTDSSMVKIMDASGNLIAQTTSNGGMAQWDGCNMQGRRVRSGVYYVFASSGPEAEQASGAVTKIIVIN